MKNFIIRLNKITNTDQRLDFIYDYIDNNLRDKNFDYVDKVLEELKFDDISITDLVGFIGITSVAKQVLKNRSVFLKRAKEHFKKVVPRRDRKLLLGLE